MVKRISFAILTVISWIAFAFFYICYPVYYVVSKFMMQAPTTAAKVAGIGLVVLFIGFIVFYSHIKKFINNLPDSTLKYFMVSMFKILPILIVSILLKFMSNSQARIDTAIKATRIIFISCVLGILFHIIYLRCNMQLKILNQRKETGKAVEEANNKLLQKIQELIKP